MKEKTKKLPSWNILFTYHLRVVEDLQTRHLIRILLCALATVIKDKYTDLYWPVSAVHHTTTHHQSVPVKFVQFMILNYGDS